MTEKQFWDRDPQLVRAYRKADEIRKDRRNQELWLQGLYIYEALCDVAPVLHSFAKKGTKPRPYAESPYPLTGNDREHAEEVKAKRAQEKAMQYMEAFMTRNNKRFETQEPAQTGKEVNTDAGN